MIIPYKDNILKRVRDNIWNYPNKLLGKKGIFNNLFNLYILLKPFSHIIVFTIISIVIGNLVVQGNIFIVKGQSDTLIEGVIVGEETLSRVNPIVPTNKQLENDLSALIYLPLLNVKPDGEIDFVLCESYDKLDEEGKQYKFNLRKDILWHDGVQFTTDDVLSTFSVLKTLGGGEQKTIVSRQSEMAQSLEFEKIDDYTFIIKLSNISPTFFEDISFGILPKHIVENVSLSTFSWAKFNLNPIGTGPFIFKSYKENNILLTANTNYFKGSPKIKNLKIILFKTGDEAVEALKNGQIHILTEPSTAILEDLKNWKNIKTSTSAVLYKRYFALYFNLKESGPEVFKDSKVRQAISSAINIEQVTQKISSAGEEAYGPIPKNSWAYNNDSVRYIYDPVKAKELLEKAGWEQKEIEGKILLMKGEQILRFELSYLDKSERQILAEMIKSDLEKFGIIVNLNPRSSSDLNEALIATRNFEAVLYGVETTIDPDRIRLWHSKSIEYPGLNISSYISSEQRSVISESKDIEKVSLIDVALENGIKSLDRNKRNGEKGLSTGYFKFQDILLSDCPVVFLYHPVFMYVMHSRVNGVDLSEMTSPRDRYLSITNWSIE